MKNSPLVWVAVVVFVDGLGFAAVAGVPYPVPEWKWRNIEKGENARKKIDISQSRHKILKGAQAIGYSIPFFLDEKWETNNGQFGHFLCTRTGIIYLSWEVSFHSTSPKYFVAFCNDSWPDFAKCIKHVRHSTR